MREVKLGEVGEYEKCDDRSSRLEKSSKERSTEALTDLLLVSNSALHFLVGDATKGEVFMSQIPSLRP